MAGPLPTLQKWVQRDDICESSDEAVEDSISLSTEMVFVRGEGVALRRVYTRVKGFAAYSRVGWIVLSDCANCMVCSCALTDADEKTNCCACGNVVCCRCGSGRGTVVELGDLSEDVSVCSLCSWGQEDVHAVMRPPPPSIVYSPIQTKPAAHQSASPAAVISPLGMKGMGREDISTIASPGDSSDDDSIGQRPPRALGLLNKNQSGERLLMATSPVRRLSSNDILRATVPNAALNAVRDLAVSLRNDCTRFEGVDQVNDMQLEDVLMAHILDAVSTLAVIDGFGKSPARNEVFKSAMSYLFDSAIDTATGVGRHESHPMAWIRDQFPCADRSSSWLPMHWCGALSSRDGAVGASQLRSLAASGATVNLVDSDTAVSVLSLAVAKSHPSTSFVEAVISLQKNAAAVADKDGAYPLMYAAAWNHDVQVLTKLYDLYPGAVSKTDSYGFTPLLFACFAGTIDAVAFLLDKYPKAITAANHAGSLPLHACAANAAHGTAKMARLLLEKNKNAVSVPDHEGSLPLHVAAQFANIELIRYLYDAYPTAATIQNDEGLLPMHLAGLRKQKSVDVLNVLTECANNSI